MAGKCYIIGAGSFGGFVQKPDAGDYVIAADAGYSYCRQAGVTPDLVVGDFDSLGAVPDFPNIVKMPVEKDDTDTLHAMRLGLEKGCTLFEVYGGTGGARTDHTVANLQSLLYLAANGARGRLYGEGIVYEVIKDETKRFDARHTGTISIFCLDGKAEGVTLRGLKYPLTDYTMTSDFPIGVSNSFTGQAAQVTVRNGRLILIYNI